MQDNPVRVCAMLSFCKTDLTFDFNNDDDCSIHNRPQILFLFVFLWFLTNRVRLPFYCTHPMLFEPHFHFQLGSPSPTTTTLLLRHNWIIIFHTQTQPTGPFVQLQKPDPSRWRAKDMTGAGAGREDSPRKRSSLPQHALWPLMRRLPRTVH